MLLSSTTINTLIEEKMKKIGKGILILIIFFSIINMLIGLFLNSGHFVSSVYALKEDCDPGWLEISQYEIKCHCPDITHNCECCYPQL